MIPKLDRYISANALTFENERLKVLSNTFLFDDYKGKLLQTHRTFLKMTLLVNFFCAALPLVLKVKFFSSDKHPSFIIQITTLRLASACLDELRAFDILHNVFALQAEVIIKTLREYVGAATNIRTEAAGSLYGMYY